MARKLRIHWAARMAAKISRRVPQIPGAGHMLRSQAHRCPGASEYEPISARGPAVRRATEVQRAFVVRLEGISSKTISVKMEKKNPRMSQPMA